MSLTTQGLRLAVEAVEAEFKSDIAELSANVVEKIVARVRDVCGLPPDSRLPETYQFSASNY